MSESPDAKLLATVRRLPKAQRPYAAVPTVICEHHPESPYADWWVADVPHCDFAANQVHHAVCVMPQKDHAVEWAQKTWQAAWQLSEEALIGIVPTHTYHSPEPLDPDALDALMATLPTGTLVTYTGPVDSSPNPARWAEESAVTQKDREEWLSTLAGVKEELEYAGSVWNPDDLTTSNPIQAMITPLPPTAEGEPGFLLWSVREGDLQRLYQHPEGQPDVVQGVCPLRFTTREQAAEAANQIGWGQTHDHGIDWTHLADISPKQYRALSDDKKAAYKLGHQLRQQLAHTTKFLDAQGLNMTASPAGPFISRDTGDIESRWRVWHAQPGLYQSQVLWDRQPDHSDTALEALQTRVPDAIVWPDSTHNWPNFDGPAQKDHQPTQGATIPLSVLSAQFNRQNGGLTIAQAVNPAAQTSLVVGWLAEPAVHWTVQAATAAGPQWQWQGHTLMDTQPLRLWGTHHITEPECPNWTNQPLPDTVIKPLGDPVTRKMLAVYASAPEGQMHSAADTTWMAEQRHQQWARYAPWAEEHGFVCNVTTLNWKAAQGNPQRAGFSEQAYPAALHKVWKPLLQDFWHGYQPAAAQVNKTALTAPEWPPPASVIAASDRFRSERPPLTQDAIIGETTLATTVVSSEPGPALTEIDRHAELDAITVDPAVMIAPVPHPPTRPPYQPDIAHTQLSTSIAPVPQRTIHRHR